MLDALGLAKLLGISLTVALFGGSRHLLYSTSAERHPVFVDGQNYVGHNLELWKHPLLRAYIERLAVVRTS